MDAKAITKKIRDALEPEVLEKINMSLIEIENGVTDLNQNIAVLKNESAQRRITAKTLQDQIEEKDLKITELSDNSKVEDLTKQIEGLKKFQDEVFTTRRKEFTGLYEKYKEHPKWDSVKNNLTIPEDEDFSQVDNETIVANVSKLKEYEGLGIFGEKKPGDVTTPKVSNTSKPVGEMSYKEYVENREAILEEQRQKQGISDFL